MNCEYIAVGTEILLGQILNTNAKFISEELAEVGIDMYYQTVVGDNEGRLTDAVRTALGRADIVITSGGLGPTNDDITKEVVAKTLGLPLEFDEASMENIRQRFCKMHRDYNKTLQEKQAYMPKGCIILKNNNGTAPGCIIEQNGKIVIVLPGPPKEIQPMFLESVKPYLRKLSPYQLYSRVIKIFGMGEANVEEIFGERMRKATNPTIAPYAKEGETTLRVTSKCSTREEGEALVSKEVANICTRLGDVVYSTEDETLAEAVVKRLISSKHTLAVAESCTGGYLAQSITSIPGASEIFSEGFVTYSNEAKQKYLNVPEKTLEIYGAVSDETAKAMAEGLREVSGADIAVSITGIAGPGGGSAEKPVGLVYIGICTKLGTNVKKLNLNGNREHIRYLTVLHALDMIRRAL